MGRSLTTAETWQVILPGLLGASLASLLLLGLLRVRWSHGPTLEGNSSLPEVTPFDRASLIREIADLDDQFEKGGHSEGEYHNKRQRLKAQALEGRAQPPGPQGDGIS